MTNNLSNNQQEGEDDEPRAIKMAKQLQDQPANSNRKQDQKNKKTVLKELEEQGEIKVEEASRRGGEQYEDEEPRQGS
ncbi:MAG TPA: hypothetical protein VE619_09620 [Nitrososphaeraceae archaeon]|nr:hypothetical protein [Nitrososphaeraceae archaeon]